MSFWFWGRRQSGRRRALYEVSGLGCYAYFLVLFVLVPVALWMLQTVQRMLNDK
jgi:hypothetical protein